MINRIVETNLQLHAHNGSGFDTWIILNSLPCDKHFVDFIRKGKEKISSRVFIGYIQNNKNQIPQYLISRCCMTNLNYSLKNQGRLLNYKKTSKKLK